MERNWQGDEDVFEVIEHSYEKSRAVLKKEGKLEEVVEWAGL